MKPDYVYIKSGTRFGKLTLLESALRSNYYVLCSCDCGNTKRLRANILKNDGVLSCGCTRRHGLRWTRVYNIHRKMLERCYNENHVAFHRYGGRGIDVCPEWHDVVKFYEDMGDPPEDYQIDRIDNDQGYRKENCRWVTPKDNCNNKSNSKKGKKI